MEMDPLHSFPSLFTQLVSQRRSRVRRLCSREGDSSVLSACCLINDLNSHTHTLAAYVSCQSALMGEYNFPLKVPVSCAELVALLHDSSHSCTAHTPSPCASLYIITGDDVVSSGTSCAHSWHCRHSRNTAALYFFFLRQLQIWGDFYLFFLSYMCQTFWVLKDTSWGAVLHMRNN